MSEEVLNSPAPKPMTVIQIRDLVASSKRRLRRTTTEGPLEQELGVSMADAQLGEETSSGDDPFDPLDDQYYGWDGSYSHPPKNQVVFDIHLVQTINGFLPRVQVPTWISRPIKQLGNQDQLVSRLNATRANNSRWVSSSDWCQMPAEERLKYCPVSSQAHFKTGIKYNNGFLQTHKKSPKNSVIHVVSRSNGAALFGKITKIFNHSRSLGNEELPVSETWLLVQYFAPLPSTMPNPFSRVGDPDLQAHLRLEITSKPYLTNLSEVVAHCAWMVYEKGEIHYLLDKKSIALLSLHR
ncbi:hypothetical protein DFH28DRAFT_888521 [Melampsora americana]|nr:hypothetical protein DFH28DRAFT_907382 [Melampsora americana]KAH9818401.1 hypothetical protein DFH28DRAFT_888521 [Melampsora americana]